MTEELSIDAMVKASTDVMRAAVQAQQHHGLPTGGLLMCLGLALSGVVLTLPKDKQADALEDTIKFIRAGTS